MWNINYAQNRRKDIFNKNLSNWLGDYLFENEKSLKERIYHIECRNGNYLAELNERGFKNLVGMESIKNQEPLYNTIWHHDAIVYSIRQVEYGSVIALDCFEYFPVTLIEKAIKNISYCCSNKVIISWTTPQFYFAGRINCKLPNEIVKHFEKEGFQLLEEDTLSARNSITNIDELSIELKNCLYVFKKIQ